MIKELNLKKINKFVSYLFIVCVIIFIVVFIIPNLLGLQINDKAVAYSMPIVGSVIRFIQTPVGILVISMFLTLVIGISVLTELMEQRDAEINLNCDFEMMLTNKLIKIYKVIKRRIYLFKRRIIRSVRYFPSKLDEEKVNMNEKPKVKRSKVIFIDDK